MRITNRYECTNPVSRKSRFKIVILELAFNDFDAELPRPPSVRARNDGSGLLSVGDDRLTVLVYRISVECQEVFDKCGTKKDRVYQQTKKREG